jgi:hypothetical protein
MLGWIHEKMVSQKSTPKGGRFFTSGSIVTGNNTSACKDLCVLGEVCSTVVGNDVSNNTHTFDPSSRGGRSSRKPSTGGSLDG